MRLVPVFVIPCSGRCTVKSSASRELKLQNGVQLPLKGTKLERAASKLFFGKPLSSIFLPFLFHALMPNVQDVKIYFCIICTHIIDIVL
jgi:hypothetical protein